MGSISGDDLSVCGDGPSAHEEKIFVAVRLRPLNEKEITRNDLSDWEPINNNTILFKNTLGLPERSLYPTAYTFDRVFGYEASTKQVYEEGAKRIALSVVSGINSSIFAYGQTSSGKTYTMSGITEYAVADIYDCIRKQKDREFVVKFSAIEIYNECVRDLLNSDSTQLRLLDDPEKGTVIEKLTEVTLRDWDHLKELLSVCEAERQIGETALNEMSSRSHQIIRLTVESSARRVLGADSSSTLTATVNFVDLAGSERASQTMSAGTRLKEGCHINRSLLTLGTVVRKLSKGRNGHVPYRDSKLTRILQNSLGGNARTAMICTMSPARSHVEQSRNTLLFAVCAKEVSNNAQVNVVMSEKALVKQLQRELSRLENELRNLGSAKGSSSHDSASIIIKEKELLIEKMEKEIRELTEQRDLAQSRLEQLLRSARNNQLLEKGAWLDEHTASNASEVIDPLTSSMFHISVKHEPQLLENPDDHYFSDEISPRLVMNKYFGPGPCMDWEKISDQKPNHVFSEDNNFKEVQSIEMEPSMDKEVNAEENLSLKKIHYVNNGEDNESDYDVDTYESLERKTEKYMHRKVDSFCGHYQVEPSPCSSDTDISDTRSISLSRSRSCRAILTTMSSPSYEKEEVHEIDFPARIEAYKVELTESKPEEDTRALSRSASRASGRNVSNEETRKHSKAPSEGEIGSIYLSSTATRLDQGAKPEAELIVNKVKVKVKETEIDIEETEKVTEKEDGSLCIASNWPFEFERQRREIIELWDTCNTPLIHRTYFFLLFKGDPSDAVYMEVELRRLSFLKNTLSYTLSARSLNRERATLSRKLAKKFSSKERESLYEKWGIDLDSKSRKVQLSRLLWTDTKNIGHVKDSAEIVAKLVGFMETSETPKEMFGLSFAPRAEGLTKSSWAKSMPSLV